MIAGTATYGDARPERDHFDIRIKRGGEVVAYPTTMAALHRYEALYGPYPAAARWSYVPPQHARVVGA